MVAMDQVPCYHLYSLLLALPKSIDSMTEMITVRLLEDLGQSWAHPEDTMVLWMDYPLLNLHF